MNGTQYDAIVVGGGHNGLTCAAYLARAGLHTVVLERRDVLGGAAVTEEPWPGFRVSTASYVVSLLVPEVVRELDLAAHGYHVYPLDPAYFAPFPDGRGLLFWDEPRRAALEVERVFGRAEAEAYLRYSRDLGELADIVRPLLLRIPPPLRPRGAAELRDVVRFGGYFGKRRKDLARLIDLMTMSVADFLAEYFTDTDLMGAMSPGGIIGVWGGVMSPGSAYVLLHHRIGEVGGIRGAWGFVRGGMGAVSEAIAAAARTAGAEIRTGAEVVAIDASSGAATSVTLVDGTSLQAAAVVSAIHPKTTLLDLVGEPYLPDDLVVDLRRYRTRGSSAKVNLALSELPDFRAMPGTALGPQHPEFIISPSITYAERAWDDAKYGAPSAHPILDCVIPTTKDPTLAPEGRHILTCFVQYAPYELAEGTWDERREQLGDVVVDTLAEYAPNLPGAILHREVLTPLDLERRFGLVGGNIFHGEMSLDQLFSLRPTPQLSGYRTPIDGLYLCASGTHPGGGVMGAPGRNAASVITRDLRKGARRGRVTPPDSADVGPDAPQPPATSAPPADM